MYLFCYFFTFESHQSQFDTSIDDVRMVMNRIPNTVCVLLISNLADLIMQAFLRKKMCANLDKFMKILIS